MQMNDLLVILSAIEKIFSITILVLTIVKISKELSRPQK